jgi:UDP-N-acetylmuramyl pentapeptide synthase
MTTMLLKNLISNLNPENAAIKINGISFDSRDIKKGNLFVSIKGTKHNGDEYIDQAISKGAKVIISSQKIKNIKKSLPCIFSLNY